MKTPTTDPCGSDHQEESCESSVDTDLMVRMRNTEENVYQLIKLIDQRAELELDNVVSREELSQSALNELLTNIQMKPCDNEEAVTRVFVACLILSEIAEVVSRKTFDLNSKENLGNLSYFLYFLDRSRALVYESVFKIDRGLEIDVYKFDLSVAKVRDRVGTLLN